MSNIELTHEHLDWVSTIRYRKFPGVPQRHSDDLLSAGALALVKAARTHDPSRGAAFKTWASRWIYGAMREYLRGIGKRGETSGTAFTQTVPVDNEIMEAICGHFDYIGDFDQSESLHAAIDTLTPQEQAVVRLHYLQDLEQQEVGDMLGVSKSRVSQIASAACQKLSCVVSRDDLAKAG